MCSESSDQALSTSLFGPANEEQFEESLAAVRAQAALVADSDSEGSWIVVGDATEALETEEQA